MEQHTGRGVSEWQGASVPKPPVAGACARRSLTCALEPGAWNASNSEGECSSALCMTLMPLSSVSGEGGTHCTGHGWPSPRSIRQCALDGALERSRCRVRLDVVPSSCRADTSWQIHAGAWGNTQEEG